jgi:hypothetical protein
MRRLNDSLSMTHALFYIFMEQKLVSFEYSVSGAQKMQKAKLHSQFRFKKDLSLHSCEGGSYVGQNTQTGDCSSYFRFSTGFSRSSFAGPRNSQISD